jgi:hypothetical protein
VAQPVPASVGRLPPSPAQAPIEHKSLAVSPDAQPKPLIWDVVTNPSPEGIAVLLSPSSIQRLEASTAEDGSGISNALRMAHTV